MAKSKKPVTKNGQIVSMESRPWNEKGKELLARGRRQSKGNDAKQMAPQDREYFLSVMNINLQDRKDKAAGKKRPGPKKVDIRSREEKMRGLFGGKR